MEYKDTYFLSSVEALKVSLEKNKILAPNQQIESIQICYYDGELLKNAPENCINVPFINFVEYFSKTKYRIPFSIDNLSDDKVAILFDEKIEIVKKEINKKIITLEEKIHKLEPSIGNKTLKIFAFGCRETILIKGFVKNILDAANALGYSVYLHTQINEMESCCKTHYLESLYNYNPDITININHLNNKFLPEHIYNFIWFQDSNSIFQNLRKKDLRKKDFIFTLVDGFKEVLKKKGIYSINQPFCINKDIFKKRTYIQKEKKIVFIGSSYSHRIKEIKNDENFKIIYEDVLKQFEKKSCLRDLKHSDSEIKYFMDKYNKSKYYIGDIYAYLLRDYCIEKLCTIKTGYEVEVYGYGFENNSIIKPYYKGVVTNPIELSKIYNSATYGFCVGGYVLMQRTLECAFSETIPLVLDVRASKQDQYDSSIEKSIKFFNIKNLENSLNEELSKNNDYNYIQESYGYKSFMQKCIDIVKKENNEK